MMPQSKGHSFLQKAFYQLGSIRTKSVQTFVRYKIRQNDSKARKEIKIYVCARLVQIRQKYTMYGSVSFPKDFPRFYNSIKAA